MKLKIAQKIKKVKCKIFYIFIKIKKNDYI